MARVIIKQSKDETMTIKEKENLLQSIFLVFSILLKRYFGYLLGDYENSLFIFIALAGFYLIHFLFVKISKDYPKTDDWEEKLNLITILIYGVAVFLLQLLNATNVVIMLTVGIILILLNVLIKTKRRAIKEKIGK